MIQTVPKWRIEVLLTNGRQTQIWLHDTFIGNVLRTVASMSFDPNPLVQIESLMVKVEPEKLTQVGVSVSRGYVSEEPPNQ